MPFVGLVVVAVPHGDEDGILNIRGHFGIYIHEEIIVGIVIVRIDCEIGRFSAGQSKRLTRFLLTKALFQRLIVSHSERRALINGH